MREVNQGFLTAIRAEDRTVNRVPDLLGLESKESDAAIPDLIVMDR